MVPWWAIPLAAWAGAGIALEAKVNRLEDEITDWSELYAQVLSERNHVIAERDEWKTKCETREFAYKQADAERKRYSEQIDELRAERDEWKAKQADLNAELESGTCEIVAQTWEDRGGDEEDTYKYELSCGHAVRMLDCEPLHNCPRCGKAVKR